MNRDIKTFLSMVIIWPMVLLGIYGVPLPLYADPAPIFISSFTPSVGWAGTPSDDESGTLIRIRGQGFDSVPENNEVLFSPTDASGFPSVKAKVKDTLPYGAKYNFDRAIGSPGKAPGELTLIGNRATVAIHNNEVFVANTGNHRIEVFDTDGKYKRIIDLTIVHIDPIDGSVKFVTVAPGPRAIAIDAQGNVYVSGRFGLFGEAIGVYDKNGKFKDFIGKGTLKKAGDIGLNDKYLYVLDDGSGSDFPKLVVFDLKGSKQGSFSGIDEGWGPNVRIAVGPRGATSPSDAVYYISDSLNKTVYKYDFSVPLLQKFNFSEADSLGRVAVDKDGFVYVDLGSEGIVKMDANGKRIATVVPSLNLSNPPLRAIDADKKLYLVDISGCGCVKVFAPDKAGELLVFVPHGAKTGRIGVVRKTQTGIDKGFSLEYFRVLEGVDPVELTRIEANQGVSTYPFIAGKETLLCAQIKGAYGHPKIDKATIKVTTPDGKTFNQTAQREEIGPGGNCDFLEMSFIKKTAVHFHIPANKLNHPGQYTFEVKIERNGKLIAPWTKPWTKTIEFHKTEALDLLFVKVTDVPNAQWSQKPPFPWFDMTAFLRGIETFKRQFPVHDGGANVRFAGGIHKGFLTNGIQESEEGWLHTAVFDALWQWQLTKHPGFDPNNVVGLVEPSLYKGKKSLGGYTYGVKTVIVLFNKSRWGSTLSHEIGHTLGLVPAGKPNHVPAEGGSPSGVGHSQNETLKSEDSTIDGFPILAWNPMHDVVRSGEYAYSIMAAKGGTLNDNQEFFESKYKGTHVDYHVLCQKLATTACSPRSKKPSFGTSGSQKFIIIGLIGRDGAISVTDSFLTTADIPVSQTVVSSDYTMVFLDQYGKVLSQDGFSPRFDAFDIVPLQNASGVFDLERPFPNDTASVEIRLKGKVLKSLIVSANPPEVANVNANVSEFSLPKIIWKAADRDGDALTYFVHYSPDGGTTFMPIATGLTATEFIWDDALFPGSNNAIFKVIANDGFHRGEATSNGVDIRTKTPQPAIFSPIDGATFTEGRPIRLRGAAFDSEDGILSGSSLSWKLNGTIELGAGNALLVGDLPRQLTTGSVLLPLDVGQHTVSVFATDSDNNRVAKEVQIEIVSDTDRDGYSDAQEKQCGGNPYDPSVVCPVLKYVVKFVCGKSAGEAVARGEYFTAINVHNSMNTATRFTEKFSIALPGEQAGPVTQLFEAKLGPDQALEIDCRDILGRTATDADFSKGFAVLESTSELDVVAVYTAAGVSGQVETLEIKHALPRRGKGCPDVVVDSVEKPIWDAANHRSIIRATIKNIGTEPAAPTQAQVVDPNTPDSTGEPYNTVTPIPALAPRAASTITFYLPYWVYNNPTTTLEFTADYKNEIRECNKENNFEVFGDRG